MMTTLALDEKTVAALTESQELLAVADPSGRVVGFFAPVKQEYADQYVQLAARMYSVWGAEGPPQRSMTTAEVIARLESLGKTERASQSSEAPPAHPGR
jgi:hypothetical protein